MSKVKVSIEFVIDDSEFSTKYQLNSYNNKEGIQMFEKLFTDVDVLYNTLPANGFKVRCSVAPDMRAKIKRIYKNLCKTYKQGTYTNDAQTREKVSKRVRKYLGDDVQIICNEENNTPMLVDANVLMVKVLWYENNVSTYADLYIS